MAEKIKLSGVPETMLQTLYARAKESRGRGAIHDAKAEELVAGLDYDFTLADKDTAMHSGIIARVACWYGQREGHMKKAIEKLKQVYPKLTVRCFASFGHGDILNHPELLVRELKQLEKA